MDFPLPKKIVKGERHEKLVEM